MVPHEMYATLFQASNVPSLLLHSENHTILAANTAAEPLLKKNTHIQTLTALISEEKPHGTLYLTDTPYRFTCSVVDEDTPMVLVQLHDISDILSEQKSCETTRYLLEEAVLEETEKRMRTTELLIRQSRMATLGEMLPMIAHQWKQPLNTLGIILQSTLLSPEFSAVPPEERQELEDRCMQLITFMGQTIDDFRMLTAPERVTGLFSPRQVLEKTLQLFQPQFHLHNISILFSCSYEEDGKTVDGVTNHPLQLTFSDNEYHCKEQCPYKKARIHGIASEFRHAALNIFSNAQDAIIRARENGKLHRSSPGVIKLQRHFTDTHIRLTVSDNGTGIPKDVLPKVFERNFTTRPDGTGLGLYMTKEIVTGKLNGTITAENTEDGASITVTLPGWKTAETVPAFLPA